MKTEIRTIIGIFALGLVGTLNGYSASEFKTSGIAVTPGEEKKVKIGLITTDESSSVMNEKTAAFAFESKSVNLGSVEFFLNESENTKTDYLKEAQIVTKMVVDKEEAKVVQKLIKEGKLPINK